MPAGLVCHVCPEIFLFEYFKVLLKSTGVYEETRISNAADWWNPLRGGAARRVEPRRVRHEVVTEGVTVLESRVFGAGSKHVRDGFLRAHRAYRD